VKNARISGGKKNGCALPGGFWTVSEGNRGKQRFFHIGTNTRLIAKCRGGERGGTSANEDHNSRDGGQQSEREEDSEAKRTAKTKKRLHMVKAQNIGRV